jgi:hypothetical protein
MTNLCGGVAPGDVNDEWAINVFKQAVGEHNTKENDTLEFVEIVSVTKQVVAGYIFAGVVKLKKGGAVSEWNVKVWAKPGGQEIEVQEFAAK